jgi:hypothetical protein
MFVVATEVAAGRCTKSRSERDPGLRRKDARLAVGRIEHARRTTDRIAR